MKKKANSKYIKRRVIALLLLIMLVLLGVFLANRNSIIKNNQIAKTEFNINLENSYISTDAVTDTPNAPQLGAGMIPIKYDENAKAWVIVEKTDDTWYDYSAGRMATVMLSDGYYKNELEVGIDANKQLASNNIGATVSTQLGTIYVWLPRTVFVGDRDYKFLKDTAVVEVADCSLPNCFKYTPTSDYEMEFSGIWVEYNPQKDKNETTTKATNMNKEDNEYGLIKNELIEVYNSVVKNVLTKVQLNKKSKQQVQDISNVNRTTIKIINTENMVPIIASSTAVGRKIYVNVDYNEYDIDRIIRLDTGAVIANGSTRAEMTATQDGIYEFAVIDVKGNVVNVTSPKIGLEIPELLGFRVDTTYIVIYKESTQIKQDGTSETIYEEISDIPLKDILKNGYRTDEINALTFGNIDFSKLASAEQKAGGKWYDYGNQKWANVVARNNASEIYYTWIPRYVYKLDNSAEESYIKFVTLDNLDSEGNAVDLTEWTLPEAFTWGDEENPAERTQIPGFWASKYELSGEPKFNLKANVVGGVEQIQLNNITNESGLQNVTYDVYLYRNELDGETLDTNKPKEEFLLKYVENIVSNYSFKYVTGGEYEFTNLTAGEYQIRIVLRDSKGLYRGEEWFLTSVVDKTIAELPDLTGYRVNTTYIVVYDKNETVKPDETVEVTYEEISNIPIFEILSDGYEVDEKTNTLLYGTVDENKVKNKLDGIDGASWYNYDNQEWANIVVRNDASEIYYTWIPRYVYRLDEVAQVTEILFIGPNDEIPSGWTLPEAFTWGDSENLEEREQLHGFWASKYELSGQTQFEITADVIGGANQIRVSSLSDGNNADLGFNYRFYLYENDDIDDELKVYFTEPEQEMTEAEKQDDNNCSAKKYVRYTEVTSEAKAGDIKDVLYTGLIKGTYDLRIVAYDSRGYYRGERWYNDIPVEDITIAELPDLTGYRVNTTYIVVYDKDYNEISNIPISEILSDGYKVDQKTNTLLYGTVDENKVRNKLDGIDGADWFDYDNQKWANIVVRNDASEIYYTWIPRYMYKLDNPRQETEIKFIGIDDEIPSGWTLPEAFTWGDEEDPADRTQLPGFWASKYELSGQTQFKITADVIGGTNKIRISSLSDGNDTDLGFNYRFYLYANDDVDDELKVYFTEPEQEMTEAEKQDDNNCSAKKYVRYTEVTSENKTGNITDVIYTGLIKGTYDLRIVAYDSRGYYRGERWYNDIAVEDKTMPQIPDLTGYRVNTTYIVVYDKDGNETSNIPISEILSDGYEVNANTNTLKTGVVNEDKVRNRIKGIDGAVWYDYYNQKWANIVVRNDASEIYYTWIPRYIYKLDNPRQETEIKFIGVNDPVPEGWTLPEAFTWGNDEDPTKRDQLPGFWATKYELTGQTQFEITADVIGGTNKIKISSLSDGNDTDLGFNYRFYLYENDKVDDKLKVYFTEPEQEMTEAEKQDDNNCSAKKYVRYTELTSENKTGNITDVVYTGLFAGVYDLRIVAYDSRGYYRAERWYNDIVVEEKTQANPPTLTGFNLDYTYYVTYNSDNPNDTTEIKVAGNSQPSGWYDYNAQKWANIVVKADGKTSYFVWVPRYIYKLDNPRQETEIKFIGVNDPVPEGWTLPEAFTWGNDEDPTKRAQLSGFWATKYELSN